MNKIISLKQWSEKSFPESKIIISNRERLENGKAALSVKRLNKDLCSFEVDIVGKSNIGKESLGKKGLHLHPRGSTQEFLQLVPFKFARIFKNMI